MNAQEKSVDENADEARYFDVSKVNEAYEINTYSA